nr:carboxypeptidase-like regulatory domain-containing protein [bacterium]
MKKNLFLMLLAVITVTGFVYANTTATLRGVVTDAASGEALQNANITLEGTTLGAAADAAGQFVITGIEPGVYTLQATRIGYEPFVLKEIRIESGEDKSLAIA